MLKDSDKIGTNKFIAKKLDLSSLEDLKIISLSLLSKLNSGIAILGGYNGDNPAIVVTVSDDLVKIGVKADKIAKLLGPLMDGGGGGKANLATAGGKNSSKLEMVIKESKAIIENILNSSSK